MRGFSWATVFTVLFLLVAASACAQTSPEPGDKTGTLQPGPYEETLDALLAAHDTEGLNRELLVDIKKLSIAVRGLNWLRTKQVATGGNSHISYLYSILSWRVAHSLPEPAKSKLLRVSVEQLEMTRWLIQSEGFQCADGSAPGGRLAQVNRQLKFIADYAAQIPKDEYATMRQSALVLMMLTFKKRENDVWLCRGGVRYLIEYLQKHPNETGKEVTVPNAAGKITVFPLDLSIIPEFVPYEKWRDQRHAEIDRLATQVTGKPIPQYMDAEHRMK